MLYILEGHEVVETKDVIAWAKWFLDNTNARVVKQTKIADVLVSTVFIGVNHSFIGGDPILFETMVFGNSPRSKYAESFCERYSTWNEAETSHATIVNEMMAEHSIAYYRIRAVVRQPVFFFVRLFYKIRYRVFAIEAVLKRRGRKEVDEKYE